VSPEYLLALVFAVAIGVALGAMGSGGSILTLPVLVYVAGVEPSNAVAMSLAIVGAASTAGAVLHQRQANLHGKAFALLGATGIAGAYLGTAFTRVVPASTLMLVFASLMVLVGILMLSGGAERLSPGYCRPVRCAVIGAVVGVVTGFLGVGGGFLIVPALVLFAGLDVKQAVGTSLAIIALNSMSGLVGQMRYADVNWTLTALFTAASLLGMMAGIAVVRRVATSALNRTFASLLIVVGLVVGGTQLA
jgi:uncharacterized membrane protein YfcA